MLYLNRHRAFCCREASPRPFRGPPKLLSGMASRPWVSTGTCGRRSRLCYELPAHHGAQNQ
jgi:hypothetical protein